MDTYLPTLKDSTIAVASTEKANKPLSKTTLARMTVATCPIVRRNQCNLTHKTIPESPRTMLSDQENVVKVFIGKYNKKVKANKAKVATASKAGEARVPRKRANGGLSDQVPNKDRSVKYCR
jgi:hypothetical protein